MSLIHWYPLDNNLKNYNGRNNLIGEQIMNTGGIWNKCAEFSENYLTIDNFTLDNYFSISFWIYAYNQEEETNCSIFNSRTDNVTGIEVSIESNRIVFYTNNDRWDTTCYLHKGEWTHITLVKDVENKKLFINGEYKTDVPCNDDATCNGKAYIGANVISEEETNKYFKGKLNDFRIYNHALSVREIFEISKSKVFYYSFNMKYPSRKILTLTDNSGYRNISKIDTEIGPFWREVCSVGTYSTYYEEISCMNIINDMLSTNAARFSISIVLKPMLIKEEFVSIVTLGSFKLEINRFGTLKISYKDISMQTSFNITNEEYSKLIITFNKGEFCFYVNGNFAERIYNDTIKAITNETQESYIGKGYKGYIDNIAIYTSVLSAKDIKYLYDSKASLSKNGRIFINSICENEPLSLEERTNIFSTEEVYRLDVDLNKNKPHAVSLDVPNILNRADVWEIDTNISINQIINQTERPNIFDNKTGGLKDIKINVFNRPYNHFGVSRKSILRANKINEIETKNFSVNRNGSIKSTEFIED